MGSLCIATGLLLDMQVEYKGHNFYLNVFFVIAPFHKQNLCLVNLFHRDIRFIKFACFYSFIFVFDSPIPFHMIQTNMKVWTLLFPFLTK